MVLILYLTLETSREGLCAACSEYTLRYHVSPWSKVLVQQKTRICRTGWNHPFKYTYSERREEKVDF